MREIPTPLAIVIIVIVLIIAAVLGWRYATGGGMGGKQIGGPKTHQGMPK
ncbi:MAG: hypothetical protein NZL85_03310 [Fimbriimonadales bacterium]|nr:hypothetical protein [Fimbriimonadales bacterium]